ncbi:hypothetical protein [Niallia sp. NCCP-28]|uniref:hypothetical protein n=1 Tax=Niallia sp. NCCP-28 TaxID=2934712 RepID=UPI00208AC7DA|nr:hypothetical protein [Niallia sp. NCCP-28]GKU84013.1 hypothetical protein NCCP28_34090 [Niallia sp. NCCP-28]
MAVPKCMEGEWGVYQVMRCYRSVHRYYAELKLLEQAANEIEAQLKCIQILNNRKRDKKIKVKSCMGPFVLYKDFFYFITLY